MGVSSGGGMTVYYNSGSRKFRVVGGRITLEKPLLVELRRFWHSAAKIQSNTDIPLAA
jgi:hypothetical protein